MSLLRPDTASMNSPERASPSTAPAISVIVPAFNAERTLADTLRSVLSQSLREFEVIVVDDGSTDATLQVARSFLAQDPRIRVIVQANSGVADARNAGIRAARAPFVAALDSDDLWHPTFLEKLHAALTARGEDCLFAFAAFRRIDMQGRVLASARIYDLSARAFNRFLIRNFVGNGSGMMFRRNAALAVGGYERRLQHEFDAPGCEDWLLQLRLAARGTVAAVAEYLVGYRRVPGAMSSDQVMMLRSRIHAFEILFHELGCADTLGARWGLGRAHAERMIFEFLAGHLGAGCRTLRRAIVLDPWGTLDVIRTGLSLILSGWVRRTGRPVKKLLGLARDQRPFIELGPSEDMKRFTRGLRPRRLARMDEMDVDGAFTPWAHAGAIRPGAAADGQLGHGSARGEPSAPFEAPDIRDRAD